MNNHYSKFINKECFIKLKDREETECTARILSIDSVGLICDYTKNSKTYNLFIPLETIAYIEHKIATE